MEVIEYNKYPDKFVTKKDLIADYFPMSTATLSRRLKVMRQYRQFRTVELTSAGSLLINVRGFYGFLLFIEDKRK